MDVAQHVARGLTNKEIGARLRIEEQTVKNYLRDAFQRVGVTNRAALAAWVVRGDVRRHQTT
jgi:DNA-binding NarL/FixJ family response regulator